MKPPLLYLVHRIPYPPNKGDKVRSFNILKRLAQRYRVYLGTFVDDPSDRVHVGALGQWCEEVCAIDLDPRLARILSLRGLATGEALSVPYYRNKRLASWVQQTVSRVGIRSAVVFSGPMAQYVDDPNISRRVIDFCDVDSAKWKRYAKDKSWPVSWLYRREGQRLLAYESAVAATADASLFVTNAEANLFKDSVFESRRNVCVMQNGVDSDFFSPQPNYGRPYLQGGPIVLFTGAMDYWPNVDAVTWFAREILPAVQARVPNVEFWIVGMNPAPAVAALADTGITVTGAVPDMRPYLAHAHVVVAPLRIARGIQNKVLEAMAMSRAVVISREPSIGLGAKAGIECDIAEDAETFGQSVVALLEDSDKRARMGLAAREFVLRAYSWSAHLTMLDQLLPYEPSIEGDGLVTGAPPVYLGMDAP